MAQKHIEAERAPTLLHLPQAGGEALHCEQVLRVVSGKRASYLGRWGDRQVFIKLFFDTHGALRHWERERRGIEALAACGLPTPALLYAGPVPQPKGYVLVTEALLSAETLAEAWRRAATHARRIALLERMGATLAAQHEAGLLQRDPHLGNFLLSGERLYSIDASKLGVGAQSLPSGRALANLALLLAQLEPRHDADAVAAFRAYARARDWAADEAVLLQLRALIDGARHRRKQRFLRKIFRECTAYACRHTPTGLYVYDKRYATPGFTRLYQDPESAFAGEGTRFLKRGNTATVVATRVDGVDVVIKRYNVKGLWHGIRHTLKRTRASVSWRNAQLLRFYGIPTPQPIAFVEGRVGPLRRTSYFVSEYVEGVEGRQFFGSDGTAPAAKEAVAEHMVAALATLARYRVRQGDLKATNVIICGETPYWVDLDAMRQYKVASLFQRAFERDLMRLRRNWEDRPELWRIFEQALERARAEGNLPAVALVR